MQPRRKIERLMDDALAETFPASDPPWFMASISLIGAPAHPGEAAPTPELDGRKSDAPSLD
jgi:hypothetical protein